MTFLRIVIPLYLLFEHDLRANAARLSRGKTGAHFSGSCSNAKRGLSHRSDKCNSFGPFSNLNAKLSMRIVGLKVSVGLGSRHAVGLQMFDGSRPLVAQVLEQDVAELFTGTAGQGV